MQQPQLPPVFYHEFFFLSSFQMFDTTGQSQLPIFTVCDIAQWQLLKEKPHHNQCVLPVAQGISATLKS